MAQYLTIDNITFNDPRYLIPVDKILAVTHGGLEIKIYYKASEAGQETRLQLLFLSAVGGSDISVAKVILPLYITKLLASDDTTMIVPLIVLSSVWYINV